VVLQKVLFLTHVIFEEFVGCRAHLANQVEVTVVLDETVPHDSHQVQILRLFRFHRLQGFKWHSWDTRRVESSDEIAPPCPLVDKSRFEETLEQPDKLLSVLALSPSPLLLLGLSVVSLHLLHDVLEGSQQVHLARLTVNGLTCAFLLDQGDDVFPARFQVDFFHVSKLFF